MKDVLISHNPYQVKSEIRVDGVPTHENGCFTQYLNKRFQLWVDLIPALLAEEYNDDDFSITFHGTELDFQDMRESIDAAKGGECTFKLDWERAKDFGEKEKDIRKLFEYTQTLPFDQLRSRAMKDSFEKAFSETFDVNVVATMSAGKSTLINAMLQRKLMPSKQGACTATITKIKDDGKPTYKTTVYGKDGSEICSYADLDAEIMKKMNADPAVSKIYVEGNIPFVDSGAVSLILIDTPGPDNARDARHGQVTADALDSSSKMLVLFVMNGGKLHDEAQDRFLKRIAASMSVGGKQCKERFLFVINKMDEYDEEDDDVEGETIPDTIKYLKEMGIDDPNIFPVAALPALTIRRHNLSTDETERKKLYADVEAKAEKLIAQKQLHLEKYSRLPLSSREKIGATLKTATSSGDILGQALVHSGILNIEETINAYVTKYCRPAKIASVVENFQSGLESAEAFAKTKKEIASQTEARDQYAADIKKLEKKLKSKKEKEKFQRKIDKLEIASKLAFEVESLMAGFEKPLTEVFSLCPEEMAEDEAVQHVRTFRKAAEEQGSQFQVAVERLLESDIRAVSKALLQEYIDHLKSISNEVLGENGLKIDLGAFAKGTLATLDPDEALDRSVDSRTETRQESRSRTVQKERKWFNPMRLFKGDYYDVTEYYTVNVTENIKFISREKLINVLLPPIRKTLTDEQKSIKEYAQGETRRIKGYFAEQFERVDKILAEKTVELGRAAKSKEEAIKALDEAQELLANLERVQKELAAILEI